MAEILTKKPQLSAPGTRVGDVLSYVGAQCEVQQVEVTKVMGRSRVPATNRTFGSSCDFNISNTEFVGTVLLMARITVPPGARVVAGSGWLFTAINQTSFVYGAQSSNQPNMYGRVIAMYNHVCAKHEARDALAYLGGNPINGPGTYEACIVIPMIFSSMLYGEHHKLPLDLNAMDSQLNLRVNFNSANAFLSGPDIALIGGFSSLEVVLETVLPTNPSQSPYRIAKRLDIPVPVPYPAEFIQGDIKTIDPVVPGQVAQITLTNLQNMDITTYAFMFVPAMYVDDSTVSSGMNPVSLYSAKVTLLNLSIMGQVLMRNGSDITSAATLPMMELSESGSFNTHLIQYPLKTPAGTIVSPSLFASKRCPIYVWQASLRRAPAFSGEFFNTARAAVAQPQLEFYIDPSEPPGKYYIFSMATYNQVVNFERGSTIFINN